MLIMIAAALAAQTAPATAPAQPMQMPMAEHSADKMKDCCCKDMKSKMDADHSATSKDEHQGHTAH
jgi:curli biogenesis system outer membrane secretion channel CsgG